MERDAVSGFEWDENNLAHIARHSVTREEAEQVFANDPVFLDSEIDDESGEQREREIGHSNALRVLFVVWTARNGKRRVVTAFDAEKKTEAAYWARWKEQ